MARFSSGALGLLASVARMRVVSAGCWDGADGFAREAWPFCQQLGKDLLMYHGPSEDGDFVKLGLHVVGHDGWSALAMGGNGGMRGASYIVVRKDGDEWVAEDRYSDDYVTPSLDLQQDVRLIFAEQLGGNLSWGVLVPRTSCDEAADYSVHDISRYMLWALGDTHTFTYHGLTKRGQFHANLITGPVVHPDLSDLPKVDVRMPNVPLVSSIDPHNMYICGIFDLRELMPDLDLNKKHHVAKFAPYLDSASGHYVHHMILFGCSNEAAADFTHGHVVGECRNMPTACSEMTWPWAVGGEDDELPPHVGMPFGEGQHWIALQMHYYNPSENEGIVDSSGVEMFLSPTLRAQDAAAFQLNGGTANFMRDPMPAGVRDLFIPTFVVPAECTETWEEDINILGVIHHAHLVGRHVDIEVVRDSASIGLLRHEKRYDFNHQSFEQPSIPQLRRGDQLTMTCSYDTSSRSAPTTFGLNTGDEMCFAVLIYYPKQLFSDAFVSKSSGLPDGKRKTTCLVGDSWVEHEFTPISVQPPTCEARGELTSPAADAVVEAARPSSSSDSSTQPRSPWAWRTPVLFAMSLAVLLVAMAMFFTQRSTEPPPVAVGEIEVGSDQKP